jgi:cell fate regulator YaaT (PSP1 superfamily)
MGCATCSNNKDGTPSGCGNNGHCLTGGCNKKNTFDWLSNLDIHDPTSYNIVEVSFKKGARKDFFKIENSTYDTGDFVVVDTGSGYDIGKISLSGELVRLQTKKKKIPKDRIFRRVIRKANDRDIEKLNDARNQEKEILVRSRAIVNTLDLNMKIGDIEYQGDKRKVTFFYTAEGRVDFRELVRNYAKEFRVKIEMRQIGSRQESARIGGIGSCGRELCCSTWLSDFRSVSTAAARYQNIAINQTKLSGQCGRLKCCLNYELDTYMEALSTFPKKADYLKTEKGEAHLIKMDIFKGIMYYAYTDPKMRGPMVAIPKDRAAEIKAMNKRKEYPEDLLAEPIFEEVSEEINFADVTGQIELPALKKKKKRRNNKNKNRKPQGKGGNRGNTGRSDKKPSGKSSNKSNNKSNNKSGNNPNNKSNNKSNSKPNNRSNNNPSDKNKGGNTDNRKSSNQNRPNKNQRNRQGDQQQKSDKPRPSQKKKPIDKDDDWD